MSERQEHTVPTLDAYVDGLLGPEDRAAFERRLEADPALRAEVELQRRIDARLRTAMTPPAVPAAAAPERAPIPMRRGGIPAWMKVAALVALAAVGAWAAITQPWQAWGPREPSSLTADVVMKRMLDEGFTPAWTCADDKQFLQYSKDRLGVAFLVRPPAAAGVELVGWTYSGGLLSEPAQILLVRAAGEPVMVAMGPKRDDREIRVEAGSGLHVQRGVYHGVVMYEISKLDHPVVVNAIVEK